MNIGFDAKRAFLNEAGLGNYSRNTLVALHKYFPQHQYHLYTPEVRTDLFKDFPLFDVHAPRSFFHKTFRAFWRSYSVSKLISQSKIELFHGLSNELPAGIHRTSVPAAVTIHDLIYLRMPGFYRPIDRKIYIEKTKYAVSKATKIIAISNQTRDDIVFYLGVPPKKIEVIYQAISERFFLKTAREDVDSVLTKYNLPARYILTVGTVEPRKNQLGVLQAIKKAKIEVPYVMVGKATAYSEKIRQYARENGLANKVRFLTNVPDDDLPALYQQAYCMVYLSHFEGFGLPPVEAMACGCPVIASSVSCLPEISGDAALLCSPEDSSTLAELITRLIADTTFNESLIRKGIERSKIFHPEERVEDLMNFYQRTAGL